VELQASNVAASSPSINQQHINLAVQKVLSGSGRAGRLRLMEKYIDHRLVARPEPDNTFWTDSTLASTVTPTNYKYSNHVNE